MRKGTTVKSYMYQEEVPKYLDSELLIDPLPPGEILNTMIFCNYII